MAALTVSIGGCGSEKEDKKVEAKTEEENTGEDGWLQDMEYIVYFGLNDKDTGTQIVSEEEAGTKINSIFEKQGVGYTMLDAFGAYVDETGKVVSNDTVVIDILMVGEEEMQKAVQEALKELNLASAMVTKSKASYRFYGAE